MENYNVHKKRLKQLRFQRKEDADISEIIDTVTKPAIKYLLPKLKPKDLEQLTIDLRMAKWNKHFTAIQYRALNITLKIAGVIISILLFKASWFIALLWGVFLIFGMDFLLNNSIVNRKEKLFIDFPDFIRITEGYLTANMPFPKAVSESIKYVGEEWKPILQQFVIECEIRSIAEALEWLKEEVDMFEVKEFVSLVKLTLEQGGDAKESFSAQADKIREMQLALVAVKIGKRETMSIIIQAPLLLCDLMVFGLPTVNAMTGLTSM
jgi:Flp pilus assembly protein TadB